MLAWLDAIGDQSARDAAYALLRDGFERLEEDFAEEQFFAAARAAYWQAPEGSPARTRIAALIDKARVLIPMDYRGVGRRHRRRQ